MKRINNENIDEIMFQLLEGEITGQEREQLLNAIEADKEYSKLWLAWQQTILSPESELPMMDTRQLKKKSVSIIPFNYKYAIAAMLVLGLGLAIFLTNRDQQQRIADGPKPVNTKQPFKQVPQPEIKTLYETKEDTILQVPLKEKIRMMANKTQPNTEQSEFKNQSPIIEEIKTSVHREEIARVKNDEKMTDRKPVELTHKDSNEHLLVIMSTEESKLKRSGKEPHTGMANSKPKQNLLFRIFGSPKFKLENDSSTRTNKKLIIENKQYKIIAGF